MAKVRAIKPGFYGGGLRDVGEVFDARDGDKASWFVSHDGGEAEPEKKPSDGARSPNANPRSSKTASP